MKKLTTKKQLTTKVEHKLCKTKQLWNLRWLSFPAVRVIQGDGCYYTSMGD